MAVRGRIHARRALRPEWVGCGCYSRRRTPGRVGGTGRMGGGSDGARSPALRVPAVRKRHRFVAPWRFGGRPGAPKSLGPATYLVRDVVLARPMIRGYGFDMRTPRSGFRTRSSTEDRDHASSLLALPALLASPLLLPVDRAVACLRFKKPAGAVQNGLREPSDPPPPPAPSTPPTPSDPSPTPAGPTTPTQPTSGPITRSTPTPTTTSGGEAGQDRKKGATTAPRGRRGGRSTASSSSRTAT